MRHRIHVFEFEWVEYFRSVSGEGEKGKKGGFWCGMCSDLISASARPVRIPEEDMAIIVVKRRM